MDCRDTSTGRSSLGGAEPVGFVVERAVAPWRPRGPAPIKLLGRFRTWSQRTLRDGVATLCGFDYRLGSAQGRYRGGGVIDHDEPNGRAMLHYGARFRRRRRFGRGHWAWGGIRMHLDDDGELGCADAQGSACVFLDRFGWGLAFAAAPAWCRPSGQFVWASVRCWFVFCRVFAGTFR
jgi:hypothetical protein